MFVNSSNRAACHSKDRQNAQLLACGLVGGLVAVRSGRSFAGSVKNSKEVNFCGFGPRWLPVVLSYPHDRGRLSLKYYDLFATLRPVSRKPQ